MCKVKHPNWSKPSQLGRAGIDEETRWPLQGPVRNRGSAGEETLPIPGRDGECTTQSKCEQVFQIIGFQREPGRRTSDDRRPLAGVAVRRLGTHDRGLLPPGFVRHRYRKDLQRQVSLSPLPQGPPRASTRNKSARTSCLGSRPRSCPRRSGSCVVWPPQACPPTPRHEQPFVPSLARGFHRIPPCPSSSHLLARAVARRAGFGQDNWSVSHTDWR